MAKKQKIVISASRRTDIPAFYMTWFMEQIVTGHFQVINPFNHKLYCVPASPEKVSTIVFWSKNYANFINDRHWETLKKIGYNLFFNFTINSPNILLEPNLPDLCERLDQAQFLADEFGGSCINWRFDPLTFYGKGPSPNNPLSHFQEIAESVSASGVKRCITSFTDMYGKVKKRFDLFSDLNFLTVTRQDQIKIILHMESVLRRYDLNLTLCCERELSGLLPDHTTISESACIDTHLLETLFGETLSKAKDTGQRKTAGCKCNKSYDIGSYSLHPCYHNCIYCYANPKEQRNRSNSFENKTS